MEFSRQGYWCGSPFSSPGDLSNTGIEARSPAPQADSLPSEPLERFPGSLPFVHVIELSFDFLLLICLMSGEPLDQTEEPRKAGGKFSFPKAGITGRIQVY